MEEINKRIRQSNIPSHRLQPAFGIESIQTRQTIMGMVDNHRESTVPINNYPFYDMKTVFNPGTGAAPFSGYAINVDLESELKNQTIALQRNDSGSYIPSSNGGLYNTILNPNMQPPSKHGLLFATPDIVNENKMNENIPNSGEHFNMNTRLNIKNAKINFNNTK